MKRLLLAVFFAFGVVAQVPNDAAIRKILADRIDVQHQGVGMVVGVIEPRGRRVVAYGAFAKGDKRAIGGDTLFEIGSVTKVFTSLLLADMVLRGEVSLNDPVAKYLPAEVKAPNVTLRQLASHTSGLPRMPGNFSPKDASNPYADYTVQQLYDALAWIQLSSKPGAHYEYSNLGAGLLGHALARRAGMDYEAVLRKRILDPLGMKNTAITLTVAMKERLAPGHGETLEPAANWDLPTLAGAGALRSTANDLLIFLAAILDYKTTALRPAMNRMIATSERRPIGEMNEVGLAWHITKSGDRELVWHNGGTGGYRSVIGFDPKQRIGVVVLSNTARSLDDIARHLLDPTKPLETAKFEPKKEAAVDPKIFGNYVGKYALAPERAGCAGETGGVVQMSGAAAAPAAGSAGEAPAAPPTD